MPIFLAVLVRTPYDPHSVRSGDSSRRPSTIYLTGGGTPSSRMTRFEQRIGAHLVGASKRALGYPVRHGPDQILVVATVHALNQAGKALGNSVAVTPPLPILSLAQTVGGHRRSACETVASLCSRRRGVWRRSSAKQMVSAVPYLETMPSAATAILSRA